MRYNDFSVQLYQYMTETVNKVKSLHVLVVVLNKVVTILMTAHTEFVLNLQEN